jgi:hemerythrin-like domain-containing protein
MRISITLLQYEHGVIRQVLDCLKEIIENETLDENERIAVDIQDFLSEFMDGFHHRKEEKFIFPTVSEKSEDMATVTGSLLSAHEEARRHLDEMKQTINNSSISDRSVFIVAGRDLVKHVTDHINEEEGSAFPLFEEAISADEDIDIYAQYEKFVLDEFDVDFMRRNEDRAFRIENEVLGPGYYEGVA